MAEQQKDRKIAMIHDVGMQVSVELGRTDKFFKDILQMKPGSVTLRCGFS